MAAATLFVYLTAYRSFGSRAALWAALFFGLTGISLNLGEFAVPDALAVPLVTASFYLATTSIFDRRRTRLLFAGTAFGLAAVTSFAALFILPAFVLWILLINGRYAGSRAGSTRRLAWEGLILPMVLIPGLYALFALSDLQALALYEPQTGTAGQTAHDLLRDVGLPAVLALISLPILSGLKPRNHALSARQAMLAFVSALLASACFLAVWVFAIYHFSTLDMKWLWQHEVYALIVLALFCGYGIDAIVRGLQTTTSTVSVPIRTVGAAGMLLLVLGSGANALAHNTYWQRSWPNFSNVLEALSEDPLGSDTRLWTTANGVYRHYLDAVLEEGLSVGPDGMDNLKRAVAECGLDILIIDDFAAPVPWKQLDTMVRESGYDTKYMFAEALTGEVAVTTKVYAPDIPCRFF
jgi:4-amino-4-deoxy-L-arabinose transferase-like glycosyltransferase